MDPFSRKGRRCETKTFIGMAPEKRFLTSLVPQYPKSATLSSFHLKKQSNQKPYQSGCK